MYSLKPLHFIRVVNICHLDFRGHSSRMHFAETMDVMIGSCRSLYNDNRRRKVIGTKRAVVGRFASILHHPPGYHQDPFTLFLWLELFRWLWYLGSHCRSHRSQHNQYDSRHPSRLAPLRRGPSQSPQFSLFRHRPTPKRCSSLLEMRHSTQAAVLPNPADG